MAILTIHKGKNQGKTFELEPPVKFGRDKETDITISDPRVSREHGRITVEDGKFYIEDLDSSNGTHVNGITTQRCEIVNGDLIQIGDTELLFQADQEDFEEEGSEQEDAEGDVQEADQEPIMIMDLIYTIATVVIPLILLAGLAYGSYALIKFLLSSA